MTKISLKATHDYVARRELSKFPAAAPIAALATLVIVGLTLRTQKTDVGTLTEPATATNRSGRADAFVSGLLPSPPQRGRLMDTDYLWQSSEGDNTPRSVLFLAHGCSHQMEDWWAPTGFHGSCPGCVGLPEERAIVATARRMGAAVVATSSSNRSSKCWSKVDGPIVARIMLEVRKHVSDGEGKEDEIPLFAFGASSGGSFVSKILPGAMKETGFPLNGFVSQIASYRFDPKVRTPSVFMTMHRDHRTHGAVSQAVSAAKVQGVSSHHIILPQHPITPSFFVERLPEFYNALESKNMAAALKEEGYLAEDETLREDPRRSEWRIVLKKFAERNGDSLVADASPLAEEMNVAYSMHEMARDKVQEALQFLYDAQTQSKHA
uniref:Uncharacterized protein n=1 Tax=Trieres chinensis TaxID=1514140 RepID=A0A7S1ZEB9_TRICV|mmetsp:Transcript_23619/g.47897  ORF Transcript_23619/g.47897 Transcript_23619/m.47897 type:complete len:380 (+) Transcript_23619:54-1193(+)